MIYLQNFLICENMCRHEPFEKVAFRQIYFLQLSNKLATLMLMRASESNLDK